MAEGSEQKMTVAELNTQNRVVIYVNNVQLEVSPWDFKLRFRRFGEASAERLEIEELAVVYMSPPQAKAFLAALSRQINMYESKFGQILRVGAASDDDSEKVDEIEISARL